MPFDFEALRAFQDRVVVLRTTEGEILLSRITFVSRSERDLIYDLIETNQPERYAGDQGKTAYSIPWEYVADIQLAE